MFNIIMIPRVISTKNHPDTKVEIVMPINSDKTPKEPQETQYISVQLAWRLSAMKFGVWRIMKWLIMLDCA